MSWIVNFYPKETNRFLRKLGALDEERIVEELEVLEKYGFSSHNDNLKKISGTRNIWEVKAKQFRIFIMPMANNTIQVLHAIIKKSNKTPVEVIELVRRRAKAFGGD